MFLVFQQDILDLVISHIWKKKMTKTVTENAEISLKGKNVIDINEDIDSVSLKVLQCSDKTDGVRVLMKMDCA